MGIEMRKNGVYYYRKRWKNGTCVSEYVGTGEIGRLMWEADRLDRAERIAEQIARRAERTALAALDREAHTLAGDCHQLAALALLAAGYHRHKGVWRRRRYDPMARTPSQDLIETLERKAAELAAEKARRTGRADLPPLPEPGDYSAAAVNAIMKRADRVDATAEDVAAARALLKARGDRLGDVGGALRQALERELREMVATGLGRELMSYDIDRRRAALGYADAPALEKPLIDHVLLCELRLGTIEQHYSLKWAPSAGGISTESARFWEGRLSAAQRRYLAAVETLAKVRRVRVELARIHPDGSAEAVAVESPGA